MLSLAPAADFNYQQSVCFYYNLYLPSLLELTLG